MADRCSCGGSRHRWGSAGVASLETWQARIRRTWSRRSRKAADRRSWLRVLQWAQGLYLQPSGGMDCWKPRNLEYEMRLSAPDREVPAALSAAEYRGGRLDWFSFDATAPAADDQAGI